MRLTAVRILAKPKTYGVTGLGGLRVGARVGDVAGLSTLVTGRGTGGGAGSGLVGGWVEERQAKLVNDASQSGLRVVS